MDRYMEQAKSAVEATTFHSATDYSWFGRESTRLTPRIQRAMTPRTARNYILTQLQSQLYTEFYVRGNASPLMWSDDGAAEDIGAFVDALSAANAGSGSWEDGWEVVVAVEAVAVRRNGLTLWVTREDLLAAEPGSIDRGAKVKLRLPKELPNVSPGYYLALSDRSDPWGETSRFVRLYWNFKAEGAEVFVRTATRLLNRGGLFFRLKVLNDPLSYTRCDAAVVYLRQHDYLSAAATLSRIYADVAAYLKPCTPAFTKTIAPGLGLAEDPGQSESFGQHRCRIFAEGMLRAYEQGARSIDDRLRIVTDCYAAEGINLSRPYLSPSSSDFYTFGC